MVLVDVGRVRPTHVKRLARDLVDADEDRFTNDFDSNKTELKDMESFKSKKLRNRVAGYITRINSGSQKPENDKAAD
jgi:small subunit ribosomal protein S17e